MKNIMCYNRDPSLFVVSLLTALIDHIVSAIKLS